MHYIATFVMGVLSILVSLFFFFFVGHFCLRNKYKHLDLNDYSVPAADKVLCGFVYSLIILSAVGTAYAAGALIFSLFGL